ncbi:MAG: hypothetical protein JWR19_4176 [Pedosphaera sp.]|nr:hypothetical protein [Pedosphaera sp.]
MQNGCTQIGTEFLPRRCFRTGHHYEDTRQNKRFCHHRPGVLPHGSPWGQNTRFCHALRGGGWILDGFRRCRSGLNLRLLAGTPSGCGKGHCADRRPTGVPGFEFTSKQTRRPMVMIGHGKLARLLAQHRSCGAANQGGPQVAKGSHWVNQGSSQATKGSHQANQGN